jgi:4-diphosphocytidyl-2-C-methyl-D-erythritol kinase
LSPLPQYALLLVKANEGASTPQVYRLFDELTTPQSPKTPQFLEALQNQSDIVPHLSNHLAAATVQVCPSVSRLKEQLLRAGAFGAEMSGSGTAVYGLFPSEDAAKQAMKTIDADFCEICRFV